MIVIVREKGCNLRLQHDNSISRIYIGLKVIKDPTGKKYLLLLDKSSYGTFIRYVDDNSENDSYTELPVHVKSIQ